MKVEIDFIYHFSELVHKLLDNSFNSYSLNDENILSKDNKDLLLLRQAGFYATTSNASPAGVLEPVRNRIGPLVWLSHTEEILL